jgi:hypothetical protein
MAHNMLIPEALIWGFGGTRFVKQIPRAQTHKGGARDNTIGVQNISRPEDLCHSPQLLIHVVLRDLVKMSAHDHVCPAIEAARDKFRKTLPVTTGELLKGDNRYDCIRVGCHEANE